MEFLNNSSKIRLLPDFSLEYAGFSSVLTTLEIFLRLRQKGFPTKVFRYWTLFYGFVPRRGSTRNFNMADFRPVEIYVSVST